MVGVMDLILVNVKDSWVERACNYAQISLVWTYNRMGTSDYCRRLRRIVVGLVAELAFYDWLSRQGIPFGLKGRTAWYEKDRWDIDVKGVPYDIKSLFVENFPRNLSEVLDWCVLVPVDQLTTKLRKTNQFAYVFAFVSGKWFNPTQPPNFATETLISSSTIPSARWLIHVPWDFDFTKRRVGELGSLVVNAQDSRDYGRKIELGGTTVSGSGKQLNRQVVTDVVTLGPSRNATQTKFFELLYVRWLSPMFPHGEIRIEATNLPLSEAIPPAYGFSPSPRRHSQQGPQMNGWYDIWLYDAKVLLVGWADINSVSGWQILRHFQPCDPVRSTQTDNYFNKVMNLNPMRMLDC
ncbi:MAG: hypothetical protein QXQ50_08885 [Candidatus Bathyarchaeia archaeon]